MLPPLTFSVVCATAPIFMLNSDVTDSDPTGALRGVLADLSYQPDLIRQVDVGLVKTPVFVGHSNLPLVARTACVSVVRVDLNKSQSSDKIQAKVARQVGESAATPAVLVMTQNDVSWWCPDERAPSGVRLIESTDRSTVTQQWGCRLDPLSVQRARIPSRFDYGYQLSLFKSEVAPPPIDPSLIARYEAQQAAHLTEFIDRVLAIIQEASAIDSTEARHQAITIAFWIVASRILRDAGVATFAAIDYSNPDDVLGRVWRHYGAAMPLLSRHPQWKPAIAAACALAEKFWGVSVASVGPEVLGRVNETVRISAEHRAVLGAHSTPTFLVDYIVSGLEPFIDQLSEDRRVFAEPACGHAGFLVAATRYLSSRIPPGTVDRHSYLRERVRGMDMDVVSSEIARLSLTLADIPNPDGWHISGGQNMFLNSSLETLIQGAGVVLANPPFEDFTLAEREVLANDGVYPGQAGRATETLRRCIAAAEPGTLIGFVLPPAVLDAPHKTSAMLRRMVLERTDIIEITDFPDGVFSEAEIGCVSLLTRVRAAGDSPCETWRYRRVLEKDLEQFRRSGQGISTQIVLRDRVERDGLCLLRVPQHSEIWVTRNWARLTNRVGQGSSLNAGAPKPSKDAKSPPVIVSEVTHIVLGEGARTSALNGPPSETATGVRSGAKTVWRMGRPTGKCRVVLNRARRSRQNWWLQAFVDPRGRQVASDGFVIESENEQEAWLTWAIINSPFVNVFIRSHAHSTENSITPAALYSLPTPALDTNSTTALTAAIDRVRQAPREYGSPALIESMLELDATVHAAYGLRAVDEWTILSELHGTERPGVGPFPDLRRKDKRIPLYIHLGLDVALPADYQVPGSVSRQELFSWQTGLRDEMFTLRDAEARTGNGTRKRRIAERAAWVSKWIRALQLREVELLDSSRPIDDGLAEKLRLAEQLLRQEGDDADP